MPPKSDLPPRVAPATAYDLNAVQQFVQTVPSLRRLFASPASSEDELLVRARMRSTIAKLAVTLSEAARGERSQARASVFRAAAVAAADLAAASAALLAELTPRDH